MLWAKENLGEGEPLVFFISLFQEQLRVVLFFLFEIFLHLNTHSHTHTIMSTKLMDATPDLKRLAPVENLAIDVISYAHGSVTPTLTNLYTKGKDSFLKVSKSFFFFFLLFLFLVPFSLFSLLSFFFVFKLSVVVSIVSMLLRFVFTHRVYYCGSRLLLEFGSKRAFVAISFFALCVKNGRDDGNEPSSRPLCRVVFITKKNTNTNESKQLYFCERTRNILGIYQHHRRVDYVVRHAGRLDRAKDVPESRYERRQESRRRLDGCSIRLGEQSQGFVPGESGHLCFHGDSNATRTVSGKHRVFEVVDDEGEERKLLEVYRTQNPRIAKRDEGSAAISVRRHQNRHPKRPRKTRFVRTFEKSRRIVASYLELEASQNGGQSEGRSVPKSSRQSNGGFEQRLRQEGDQIGERSRANRAV